MTALGRRGQVYLNFLNKKFDGGTKATKVFTDGKTLHSYGTHYDMAVWSGIKYLGKEILYVNANTYSVTTAGHHSEFQRCRLKEAPIPHTVVPFLEAGLDPATWSVLKDVLTPALNTAEARIGNVGWALKSRWVSPGVEVSPEEAAAEAIEVLLESIKIAKKLKVYRPVKCRKLSKVPKSNSYQTILHMMAVRGAAAFDDEIQEAPMKVFVLYRLLGGMVPLKRKSKNVILRYLDLRDTMKVEDAPRYLTDKCLPIRWIAERLLDKGE